VICSLVYGAEDSVMAAADGSLADVTTGAMSCFKSHVPELHERERVETAVEGRWDATVLKCANPENQAGPGRLTKK
jgi:hypothetical protein